MTATTAAPTTMRSPLVARIGMIIFAVQGLGTGLWATVDPRELLRRLPRSRDWRGSRPTARTTST